MLNPLIKRVAKLVGILLIINSFLFNNYCYSQVKKKFADSTLLKKEIDAVLAKHGLKSTGFSINVISINQKGGQTAYSITNNYYTGIKKRTLTMSELNDIVSQIPDKNSIIQMCSINNAGKEGELFATQIANNLISNGYKNVQNGFSNITELSNSPSTKNYQVSRTVGDSTVTIGIYPAPNVD